jgi:hypothetical protein
MNTGAAWIVGGAAFGLVLGLIAENTPVGLAIVAVLGAAAGWAAHHVQHRRARGKEPRQ